MHIRSSSSLIAACVATATLMAPAIASAHYYAETQASSYFSANNGAYVVLQSDILSSTCNNNSKNFVNHEMWYWVDPNASTWVEVGVKDGVNVSNNCMSHQVFWADERPGGGGYHEHYPNVGWSLGSGYAHEVINAGSTCSWTVYFGGVNLGTSTNNCPGSGDPNNRLMTAGIETTSQSVGNVRGWEWGFNEDSPTQGWIGCGWDGNFIWDNAPPYIQTISSGFCGIGETEEVLNESY